MSYLWGNTYSVIAATLNTFPAREHFGIVAGCNHILGGVSSIMATGIQTALGDSYRWDNDLDELQYRGNPASHFITEHEQAAVDVVTKGQFFKTARIIKTGEFVTLTKFHADSLCFDTRSVGGLFQRYFWHELTSFCL